MSEEEEVKYDGIKEEEEEEEVKYGISFQEYKNKIRIGDTGTDELWTKTIEKTLLVLKKRSLNFSIYRVPSKLRNINEDAYSPRMVSIGPFHQSRKDLLKMEEHKWRYMLFLLARTKDRAKLKEALKECVKAINGLKQEVTGCYAEDLNNVTWNELREIVLVDGCFIVELIIRYSEKNIGQNPDEVINGVWMIPTLKHDLALLENQIPFFVLQKLFKIIERSIGEDFRFPCSLTEYALLFFFPESNSKQVQALNSKKVKKVLKSGSLNRARHLLEILHIFYLPSSLDINPRVHHTWGFKHGAAKLLEAGIGIEKVATSDLLEITFSGSEGVIKLPPLSIDETMETVFRNLIAFEQCSVGVTHHITSYAMLIKSLIASTQDMELLQNKQIIEKSASSGEDVPTFFKRMSREVVLKEFCFAELCDDVDKYSRSWLHCRRIKAYSGVRCRRYITALRNDYFSNPWTIISFVAAVVLLVLTLLQTMYAMLSYY
ncbi:UPF0481 protein At3g47200-like [Cornus florida]|uniref:UPF0481 protein At3g47200-like n=1 Tax=Cornus florida TaxID=4283 RepID=UPI0028A1EF31|nr:UPF0481 protein At3g47200-like [Cornus florida]